MLQSDCSPGTLPPASSGSGTKPGTYIVDWTGLKSVSSFFQKSPSRTPVLLFLALNFKINVPSFNDLFHRQLSLTVHYTKGSSLETHTYLYFFLEYSSAKSQTLQTRMPIHLLCGEMNSIFCFHFSLTRLHILRMNKGSYLLAVPY